MKKIVFLMIVIVASVAMAEDASPVGKYNVAHYVSAYEIGDIGPAGGTIFYDKGNDDGGWRYLEAAPEDLGGDRWKWGGYETWLGNTSTAMGGGESNTKKIQDALEDGTYAAKACADYRVKHKGETFDDWFLPSKEELDELYKQRAVIQGLNSSNSPLYMSSSEYSPDEFYVRNFASGKEIVGLKNSKYRFRPIRSFKADDVFVPASFGPAGGKIFFDKGNYDGGWRYLEMAPKALGEYKWGGDTETEVGSTSTNIGTGKTNTDKIAMNLGKAHYAAKACSDYSVNGYDDWFLPSKDELNEMYKLRRELNIAKKWYWTSSVSSHNDAWRQSFENGEQNSNSTSEKINVYPIRIVGMADQQTISIYPFKNYPPLIIKDDIRKTSDAASIEGLRNGVDVSYSIKKADGSAVPSAVSIASDTGIVTVADGAGVSAIDTYTVTATGKGKYTGTVTTEVVVENKIVIGDTGPAGGTIFYDKGFYSDGWRFLEVAPEDLPGGDIYEWGGYEIEVGGTSSSIGSGMANTRRMVSKLGSADYAAKACLDYSVNGYDDWFLPSKDELNEMYKQRKIIGGFATSDSPWYWSSSESSSYKAWEQNFDYGSQYRYDKKYGDVRVRAVRAF